MKSLIVKAMAVALCAAPFLLPTALPAQAQTLTPVTFSLDFRALGRHAAWYVALDKGYFKEAGFDVNIIAGMGTAQAIQTIQTGAVQFAFSDVAALVAARSNSESSAKMVAVIYQKAPYAIFSWKDGANVSTAAQLEGLEIGSGAGSFTQKVIEAFMQEKGLKKPAQFVNVDPSARVAMLAGKKVPAVETFIMSQPGIERALGEGKAQTFLLADHGLNLYSNGIVVSEEFLKSKPDLVKGFVAAALKGWNDTIADPAGATDIIVKYQKALDRAVVRQEIAIVNDLVLTPETKAKGLGTIDEKLMTESIALISKVTGGTSVPVSAIADPSFLPATPIRP
ncbi:ABC transporter substrate-binding protein [Xanthobacteraceae bacterium A53D]